MEKHINKLSPRILSLNGKAIIASTLILSKTSFLSNIFPIDTKTALSIQNKIFQYIWRNKQEPIARKTIFLSKRLGDLYLLEPQAHNIAMRIKHLIQLKQKQRNLTLEECSNLLVSNRPFQLFQGLPLSNG